MSLAGLALFSREAMAMAERTASFGWDKEFLADDGESLVTASQVAGVDLGARPIDVRKWKRVFQIAVAMARAIRHLPTPELMAYPEGHAGLLWSRGDRKLPRFELRVFEVGQRKDMHGLVIDQKHEYEWTQTTELGTAAHQSRSLHDVAQALASTIRKPTVLV